MLAAAAPVELHSILGFALVSSGTSGLHIILVFFFSLCIVSGGHDAL